MRRITSVLALSLSIVAASPLAAQQESALPTEAGGILKLMQQNRAPHVEQLRPFESWFPARTELTALERDDEGVTLVFNLSLGQRPWLREYADAFIEALRQALGEAIAADDALRVEIDYGRRGMGRIPFEEHVSSPESIQARQAEGETRAPLAAPVIQRPDYPGPKRVFEGRNVVVSASHGITWHKENRWQFQRARLFTTIEDLYVLSIVNPFLAPMYEQAGMTVWSVRERDWQHGEIIVDNDGADGQSQFEVSGAWQRGDQSGWRGGRPGIMVPGDEPFTAGTTLVSSVPGSQATFIPEIPHEGRYAVYLSWAGNENNSASVPVEIRHLGGTTTVLVNQQVAGGTWVLAGFYQFPKGIDRDNASVTIAHDGTEESRVTVDAVRFGGGVGNAAPGGRISGYPRWAEGAHYWLQHAGAPHGEVVGLPMGGPQRFSADYNRDIASRAEWPNYLQGAPGGPNSRRNSPGLGVPVDMMINWHTDAGISNTGLIGSLSIYRIIDHSGSGIFPDGRTRWLNRDLASLVHDEIMHTLRGNYTSTWTSRALMEGDYGEARRPNVPVVLLEPLSHQNFHEMKYALDPRFKRDIARAVYKGSVRFMAWSLGVEPVFTPLAPEGVAARSIGGGSVVLDWIPREDPLEPTASPDGFIVYRSTDGFAFDNGLYFESSTAQLDDLEPDVAYYFRVTAANAGGESFPSPVVGVRWSGEREPVLVVDGFDRISGPAAVQTELARGFDRARDPGVGYEATYGLVGEQYDFDVTSPWQNDLETPGYGASRNDWEKRLEPGNLFNHVAVQGALLQELDVPFDSVTAKGAELVDFGDYPLVSWIAGRQRTQMPPEGITTTGVPDRMEPAFEVLPGDVRSRLGIYLDSGGRLLIAGAHVCEDLLEGPLANGDSREFARLRLGIRTASPQATRINAASGAIESNTPFDDVGAFRFGRDLEPPINILPTVYGVPSAEGFFPSDGAQVVLQYGDSRLPAAVATDQTLIIGFPIETVMPPARRAEVMRAALETLAPGTAKPRPE